MYLSNWWLNWLSSQTGIYHRTQSFPFSDTSFPWRERGTARLQGTVLHEQQGRDCWKSSTMLANQILAVLSAQRWAGVKFTGGHHRYRQNIIVSWKYPSMYMELCKCATEAYGASPWNGRQLDLVYSMHLKHECNPLDIQTPPCPPNISNSEFVGHVEPQLGCSSTCISFLLFLFPSGSQSTCI